MTRVSVPILGAFIILAAAFPAAAEHTILNSTFLGGSRSDVGLAVAVQNGNTFIAGTTYSLDYPVVAVTSSKPEDEQTSDVFVTALDSSGTPMYSTYVAMGNQEEDVLGIGVAPDGSAYVAALAYHGIEMSAVVAKLEPWGELAWRREAAGRFYAQGMTVDSQGNVYVTGRNTGVDENDVPLDTAFLWKLDSEGATSYWAEIDGDSFDIGSDVAVDAAGNAYVVGITGSTDLPGADQPAPEGVNAFVTGLDAAGAILWSTYLGGSGEDQGVKIDVAADGNLVVAGTTKSTDLPTQKPYQAQPGGLQDLLLARLAPRGEVITLSYLGGSENDDVLDLDQEGASIYLAAVSPPGNAPHRKYLDPACGGSFLAKLDLTGQPMDAACVGSLSAIYGLAADSTGVSLAGAAGSDLPVVDAWQPAPAGAGDAFAAKLIFTTRKVARR